MCQTITLNSSETVIPLIGFGAGTKWISGDKSKSVNKNLIQSIHDALSLGYRHIDTSEMYGTDISVSEAIRTQSISRNELFITSKVYKGIENIEQACLDVLSRLNIDYLDLWLIHAPFFNRNKISIEQAWKQMEKLVENGKVKAIGVSNFQKEHLEEILSSKPKIKPAVNQIEFNPYVYNASKELVEYCKSNGIAIEAYASLGPINHKPGGPVDDVVEKLAKKYNRSPAQILLKWNLMKSNIILTTSSKREHLEDFFHVFDENFQLDDDDIKAIDDAGAKLHFRKFFGEQIDGGKREF